MRSCISQFYGKANQILEQCAAGGLSGSRHRDTEINRHDGEDVGLFDELLTNSGLQAAFVDEPGPHGH